MKQVMQRCGNATRGWCVRLSHPERGYEGQRRAAGGAVCAPLNAWNARIPGTPTTSNPINLATFANPSVSIPCSTGYVGNMAPSRWTSALTRRKVAPTPSRGTYADPR